jgi:hypothetical protein
VQDITLICSKLKGPVGSVCHSPVNAMSCFRLVESLGHALVLHNSSSAVRGVLVLQFERSGEACVSTY